MTGLVASVFVVGAVAAVLSGQWRRGFLPFTIRPGRMTAAALRLDIQDQGDARRVDAILRSFITAFNKAIAAPGAEAWMTYCSSLPALFQPFAHEGGAMGYTLRRLFRFDPKHFEQTIVRPRPEFRYLYYVGLGFWSGLRRHSPAKLAKIVRHLDPLHGYLVYDGYGFARMFFESRKNPQVLRELDRLHGYARNAAYQGVGRALYFLYMGNESRLITEIEKLHEHAPDAAAGVGLAAVFVNPDRLSVAQRFGRAMPAALRAHFHLGMCFGLKARSINQLDEFEANVARLPEDVQHAIWASIRECDRVELLVRAENGIDPYRRWRERVTEWLTANVGYPMLAMARKDRSTSSPEAGSIAGLQADRAATRA